MCKIECASYKAAIRTWLMFFPQSPPVRFVQGCRDVGPTTFQRRPTFTSMDFSTSLTTTQSKT